MNFNTIFDTVTDPYVNKVIHGSITIANGANSGTATIPQVGPFAFLIFLGYTCTSATSQSNIIATIIALSNNTTVSAARNSNDTGTITAYFAVVDATFRLVESVQQSTASFFGQSSKTATITSVDTTRSAVFWLGNVSSDTSAVPARRTNATITNATTVTCTSNSTHTGLTGFVVVQFRAGVVQSLQQFNAAFTTANLTDTQAISAVTMANTMIAYGGINNGGASYEAISLTSTTNVNLVRLSTGVASRTPAYTVIEFIAGVFTSASQRGVIALANATSATATITAVGTKAVCNWNGFNSTSADTVDKMYQGVTLTNTTTVTGFVNTNSASAKNIAFEVLNFN